MWRNLEHVTGAYSEHAKKKRYEHRREAWGDAHRAIVGLVLAGFAQMPCISGSGVCICVYL
jgi:hypothetical protein